jgi:hypothetical protein
VHFHRHHQECYHSSMWDEKLDEVLEIQLEEGKERKLETQFSRSWEREMDNWWDSAQVSLWGREREQKMVEKWARWKVKSLEKRF